MYEREQKKRSSFWLCELLARACRCIIKQRLSFEKHRRDRRREKKGSTSNVVGKTWSFRVHTRLIRFTRVVGVGAAIGLSAIERIRGKKKMSVVGPKHEYQKRKKKYGVGR